MSSHDKRLLESIALLLEYPNEEYSRLIDACEVLLNVVQNKGAEMESGPLAHFQKFSGEFSAKTREEAEEAYTRTFDLNPVCSLDIGWHLYGEQYARGDFLVTMRSALREHAVEETGELPDHLPSVLKLVARTSNEHAEQIVRSALQPSLSKMIEGLSGKGNPFEHLILTVQSILDHMYPNPEEETDHD